MIGKDTKEAYTYFRDFFLFFEKMKREGLPASVYGPRILPMEVWSPQDLSSIWKCLNTGSGAKKNCHSYFCHVCPCSSRDILFFTVGENRCEWCRRTEKDKCYHWEVGDENTIARFQRDLEAEMAAFLDSCKTTLEEVKSKTKMKYCPSAMDHKVDIYSIDYALDDTESDEGVENLYFFSSLLTDELRLRNLPVQGNLAERRERLKRQLILEERLHLILLAVERSGLGKEAALMLIMQAIPCIMHLENRVGEKILTMLLAIGAEVFQKHRPGSSLKLYIEQVENIVCKHILGTEWRPKQWRVPMKEGAEEIGKVSLSNSTTGEFITGLGPLIDFIFQHPDDSDARNKWHEVLRYYTDAMDLLRQPTEFTDEEIDEFRELIDNFYKKWIALVGREGITNYIHMLGSGHISHYLTVHRNLYKFSQQNWESLNEKMKVTYFRNTQRGGNYGKNTQENERSHLLSVLKVFQHELLWLSGIGDEVFNS